jgi:hypothetical protein
MRDPSGLDCTAIEFTNSAREAGFFTIDLSSDMRSMVVAFEDFVAAWRGMSQEKPAPDLALGPQDRVFRLERTNPSACKTLDEGIKTD